MNNIEGLETEDDEEEENGKLWGENARIKKNKAPDINNTDFPTLETKQ